MTAKKLFEFEKDYKDFYVPTSVIKVGGRDLVRDLFLTVTATEVELGLNTCGRFSFTIASAFDWKEREFLGRAALERVDLLELFAFGAEVEVSIGYGEPARLKPILKGMVTKIGTSFAESGTPALTIGGFDALHALGIGAESDHWEDIKPSDAVVIVAERNSLPVKITSLDAAKKRIDQSRQSDFAFIVEMAKLTKSIFYLRDGVLNFGRQRRDAEAVAELGWGEGLSSFSPTANIAKQIGEVQVRGWSAADGKPVVGRARIGDEEGVDSGTESGAQRVGEALGKTPILSISAAVHSQQEADERAKAIFKELGQELVTGDGECVGLPDLLPDTNVAITGVGRAFSKTYYITDTTHAVDAKGYRTRFKVKDPSI